MLNELLANLMQMQSQSQSGEAGKCSKPGGKNPKPGAGDQLSDIITQQQQLGKSMQQAGKSPGKGKEGKQPGKEGKDGKSGEAGKGGEGGAGGNGQGKGSEGDGEYGDAEQLARLAEQQASIRRQIQDLQSKLAGTGMGNSKELREIQQQMDKNESDLVNRKLTSQFLMRQQEIMTRLLQAEKSIREQEQDDKRASNAAKEISRPVPPELQRYAVTTDPMILPSQPWLKQSPSRRSAHGYGTCFLLP
jgi:hypothetical protein